MEWNEMTNVSGVSGMGVVKIRKTVEFFRSLRTRVLNTKSR